jgi:hypothetical protein
MFRRRPFRRPPLRTRPPRRALRPARPLADKARRALARANRLFSQGQFAEAAAIFQRLADGAERRGILVRAAELYLQASRAHLSADAVEPTVDTARRALHLLARGGRPGRVPQVLSRICEALRGKGYDAEADGLEREAAEALRASGLSLEEARQQSPRAPKQHGTLPARCSGCGAPLTPEGVEWHDAQTAECPYCGTIAKTT